jgi:hypothetical protein
MDGLNWENTVSTPTPWPIYPHGGFGYWWQRVGAGLATFALLYTAWAAYTAPPCTPAHQLLVLAALWGTIPPLWWWFEFFFVFPRHHTAAKLELLKHGAQASLAIWAPIAVALAAYSTSDYFKIPEPPKTCLYSKIGPVSLPNGK